MFPRRDRACCSGVCVASTREHSNGFSHHRPRSLADGALKYAATKAYPPPLRSSPAGSVWECGGLPPLFAVVDLARSKQARQASLDRFGADERGEKGGGKPPHSTLAFFHRL